MSRTSRPPSALIFCLTVIVASNVAWGGGALSRVRGNVRTKPSAPTRDSDDDDDDDDHNDHQRPSRQPRRAPHHHAPSLIASRRHYCPPPIVEQRVVEHHVYVYEPPLTSAETIIAEPIANPIVAAPAPLTSGYPATVVETTATSPPPTATPFHQPWMDDWSLRLSAFYGADFNDLSQANISLLLQNPGSLGIETSATTFRESWDNSRDNLWIGDVNFVFETFHVGDVRGRIGIGVNWLADTIGAEAGLNLTAGFDMQLAPRWTLTGEADIGNLGAADFWHGQLSVGRQFHHAEWIGGFDHYNIGGEHLYGAFTGLRFRF